MPYKIKLILISSVLAITFSCSREDAGIQPPSQYGELFVHGYYQMIGPNAQTVAISVQRDQFVLCAWGRSPFPKGKFHYGYFDAKTATFYFKNMPSIIMQASGFDNAWSLRLTNDDDAIGDFRKVGNWSEAVSLAPQNSACKSEPLL